MPWSRNRLFLIDWHWSVQSESHSWKGKIESLETQMEQVSWNHSFHSSPLKWSGNILKLCLMPLLFQGDFPPWTVCILLYIIIWLEFRYLHLEKKKKNQGKPKKIKCSHGLESWRHKVIHNSTACLNHIQYFVTCHVSFPALHALSFSAFFPLL